MAVGPIRVARRAAELGYRPATSFEAGLAATVAWYRENRAWWEPLKSRAALV
jgi:dTDP-glucose 4,6-dehydratase